MKKLILLGSVLLGTFFFAQTVGGDQDAHGCKGSAGYTYSQVQDKCIRVFEQKIKLKEVKSNKSYETIAAVVWSADKNKAEVFLANEEKSVILEKMSGKKVWKNKIYTLAPTKKGYSLKKVNIIIYQ